MIIWGGCWDDDFGCLISLNTGGSYDPVSNTWTVLPTNGAPLGRVGHSAIVTNTEMIVWGGCNNGAGCVPGFNTGGRYNPATNSWNSTATIGAPSNRLVHTAVWTGSVMIIWGGYGANQLNTGSSYNPSQNSWNEISTNMAPSPRSGHSAVWTGNDMIIWGGADDVPVNTGGIYNPSLNSWTATSQ